MFQQRAWGGRRGVRQGGQKHRGKERACGESRSRRKEEEEKEEGRAAVGWLLRRWCNSERAAPLYVEVGSPIRAAIYQEQAGEACPLSVPVSVGITHPRKFSLGEAGPVRERGVH
ncbi:unnamed protein product [Pleuronectes platessa]|uniref:Uncharacterized protein n=1 Tax=Pleuronectes platessa TaxID=8262 RepID=A0A9N7VUH1_PLEPL|nr:unnamed protein product [Pleuronectes platessa]